MARRLASRYWARDRYARAANHPLAQLPNVQFALIPDPAFCELQRTWKHEPNDTHYMLQASDDFNLRNTFAIEFWFRKGLGAGNPTRCFASRANGANAANTQWVIGSFDSVAGGSSCDSICVALYNPVDANYAIAKWQFQWTSGSKSSNQNNTPPYAHVIVQYNGAEAVATDRLSLWVNGTEQTFDSFTNTIPSQLASISGAGAQLEIGRGRRASYVDAAWTHYLNGVGANSATSALGPTRIFAQADHQLTGAEIAQLYNGGRPLPWGQLPTTFRASGTQPVMASWEWSGNGTVDESGNGYTLTASGSQRLGNAVLSVRDPVDDATWTPRWSSSLDAWEIGVGGNQTTLLGLATAQAFNYAAAPELIAAGNGWAFDCKGGQFLTRDLGDGFARGDGFTALHAIAPHTVSNSDLSSELFGLTYGSKTVTNDYACTTFTGLNGTRKWSTRSRSNTASQTEIASWNEQDLGTAGAPTIAADGAWHVVRVIDAGGTSVWAVADNGVAYAMQKQGGGAAAVIKGFNSFDPGEINLAAIHALPQGGKYSCGSRAYYGPQVVYSPALSADALNEAETYIRNLYGV